MAFRQADIYRGTSKGQFLNDDRISTIRKKNKRSSQTQREHDLRAWLESINPRYTQYAPAFDEQGVDLEEIDDGLSETVLECVKTALSRHGAKAAQLDKIMSTLRSRTSSSSGKRPGMVLSPLVAADATGPTPLRQTPAAAAAAAPTIMEVPEDLKVDSSLLSVGQYIGVGASATVHDATYSFNGEEQPVVFKRFNPEMLQDPRDQAAIKNEVILMHSVEMSPFVISLLGVAAEPRALDKCGSKLGVGLMLEKASEGSAYDVLRRDPPPSWDVRTGLLLDSARGMLALHGHKIPLIHRDLKSLNILVCKVPQAGGKHQFVGKVADFGLAHTFSKTTAARTKTKGAGSFPWMAPEVYDGKYTPATDVWAFGMMIYEFMTRKLPYDGKSQPEIFAAVKAGRPPDLSLIEDGCPEALKDIMLECLAVNPKDRVSFIEIIARLESASPRTMATSALAASAATVRTRGGGDVSERLAAMESMQRQMQQNMERAVAKFESETESLRSAFAGCTTPAQVEAMMNRKEKELKTFMAKFAKSLPRPSNIEASKKWLGMCKVVELTFVCPVTSYEYKVKSRSWSLWLKFGVMLVKTGNSALRGDLVGTAEWGINAFQSAYDAFHENEHDTKNFQTLMEEPFLTSSEHDELLTGLRSGGYFDKFHFDAQRGEFVANDRALPKGASAQKALMGKKKKQEEKRQNEAKQAELWEEQEAEEFAARNCSQFGLSVEMAKVEATLELRRARHAAAKGLPADQLDVNLIKTRKAEVDEAEARKAKILENVKARDADKAAYERDKAKMNEEIARIEEELAKALAEDEMDRIGQLQRQLMELKSVEDWRAWKAREEKAEEKRRMAEEKAAEQQRQKARKEAERKRVAEEKAAARQKAAEERSRKDAERKRAAEERAAAARRTAALWAEGGAVRQVMDRRTDFWTLPQRVTDRCVVGCGSWFWPTWLITNCVCYLGGDNEAEGVPEGRDLITPIHRTFFTVAEWNVPPYVDDPGCGFWVWMFGCLQVPCLVDLIVGPFCVNAADCGVTCGCCSADDPENCYCVACAGGFKKFDRLHWSLWDASPFRICCLFDGEPLNDESWKSRTYDTCFGCIYC